METFYTSNPKGKFIALFSDGSGASLFWRLDDDAELPDDFKFWFEVTS